ncbi:hypothetical protein [Nitrosopumilus sp.]|uniref:hypothetical protein n=1 Tax=Nitrosopumilus sp. TaxID=2024843 RepID=UPI003B594251
MDSIGGLRAAGLSKLLHTNIVTAYSPDCCGIHETEGENDCPFVRLPVIQDSDSTAPDESWIWARYTKG